MTRNRSFQGLILIVILGIGAAFAYATFGTLPYMATISIVGCAIIVAYVISSAIQVADQWSRAVCLAFGQVPRSSGPGALSDHSSHRHHPILD
jgi:hypothetical protein